LIVVLAVKRRMLGFSLHVPGGKSMSKHRHLFALMAVPALGLPNWEAISVQPLKSKKPVQN
jgi:hypothetical protein